ncbi:hypothetical protein RND81_06G208000 [Saponaria officinalis]|uniref:Uncharacterized protein n=1 Tax=Saponaria officinalis TaxID=3572 RepID=A0AAW1KD33_SAPOF
MSSEMLSFVHAQVGFLLLFDLHFTESVDQFLLSETMQPSEIFPFVIRDPNRWSLLVPRNRYWGLHPPPAHIEDVVEDGLLAIQRAVFLKRAGVDTNIDNQFLLNPPSRTALLESALKNLVRYLQATRNKDLQQPVKEGVDTLPMYLYRSLNCREEMEKLACSENICSIFFFFLLSLYLYVNKDLQQPVKEGVDTLLMYLCRSLNSRLGKGGIGGKYSYGIFQTFIFNVGNNSM